ncbi:MAG TPA: hypothetical protein VF278_24220 [Pirellulales bacterium]
MFTSFRRYLLSFLDRELVAALADLAGLHQQIIARDDRLTSVQRRLTDAESRHAQTTTVLSAERDSARHEVAQLTIELADVRHELDKTTKALAVAEEENRRLWALCQRDHARVAKERALLDRARAEAETSVGVGQADE